MHFHDNENKSVQLMEGLEMEEKLAWLEPYLIGMAKAIIILIVGWVISKWANRFLVGRLKKRNVDLALARFLGNILQYTVLAAAVIASLGTVGVQTTSLVAVFASAGLAIGLALQGSLGNFASGIMILFFRPFNLGDKVEAGGKTGRVQDIGLFATTLLTPDNEKIIIPNSAVTGGSIINYTSEGTLRGCVEVGVAYGADVVEVTRIMESAAKRAELVLKDPKPAIAFVGLGASSLDFKVLTWCKSADYIAMLHNVRHAVYDDLNKGGIEIPFNQIVIHKAA